MLKIFFIFSIVLLSMSGYAQEQKKGIAVNGEASIFVEPDMLNLIISIETQGDDFMSANQKNNAVSGPIFKVINRFVSEGDIQNAGMQNYKSWDGEHKKSYAVSENKFMIKLRHLPSYKDFMMALGSFEHVKVHGNQLMYSQEASLQQSLLTQALQNAKQKALLIAQSYQVNLGKPTWVEESTHNPLMFQTVSMLSNDSAENTQNIAPISTGKIEFKKNVYVIFAIQ